MAVKHVIVQDNRPMEPGQVRLGLPGELFCYPANDPRCSEPGYRVIMSGTLGKHVKSSDPMQSRKPRSFVGDNGAEYEVFRDGSAQVRR